jgi:type II secretory pathway pseudopilin PulG
LIELMIVIAIIAIIAAIAIPALLQSQRASNERNASASLKTVATAESDFKVNDRDGNRVNDYWTYDVAGLYTLLPANSPLDLGRSIKLIEISIAGAETYNISKNIAWKGTETELSPTNFLRQAPKAGYWYEALISDNTPTAAGGTAALYATDTDGTTDLVHHSSIFGVAAYPDSMSAGKQIFVINEGNTMFKRSVIGEVRANPGTNPPGQTMIAGSAYGGAAGGVLDPNFWPSDLAIQSFYGRMD